VMEAIFKTVWELKKEGLAESTVEGYGNKLKVLSKIADLSRPESVREVIAQKNCGAAYKEALGQCLSSLRQSQRSCLESSMLQASERLALRCECRANQPDNQQSLTPLRIGFLNPQGYGIKTIEFHSLTLRSIDLERGVITVKSAKGGNPRMVMMKPATLAMLKEYVGSHNFALDDRLFPDSYCMRHAFQRCRNDVAVKLHQQPELRKIRLYDLRHFFEQGFEYAATTPEGHMLFKKLK
jgi:hypothetical protein